MDKQRLVDKAPKCRVTKHGARRAYQQDKDATEDDDQ